MPSRRQAARALRRLALARFPELPARRDGRARADQDAVSVAKQKLAALPSVGDGDQVPVPFRYEPDPPFELHKADMTGARHTKVALDSLRALEPVVQRAKVAKRIEQAGAYSKIPWVLRTGGENYIADGHHRLAADALLGKRRARVNLLNIGDGE